MATTLYLRTTSLGFDLGFATEQTLSTTAGAGNSLPTTPTTASGNHIVLGTGGPQGSTCHAIQVGAFTCSGTISFNYWAAEDTMSANAGMAAVVSRYDSTGAFVSDVVAQGNANHADGVEMAVSTPGLLTWSATPTSTTFANNDYLVVVTHIDAVGTMGTGSVNVVYNGGTGGASGDTFVTFAETIPAPSAGATSFVIPHRHRGLIVR